MPDIALQFGGDLSIGPTGDILLASGSVLTEQRVLRRLLTNPGDYIWQLNYGGGLGQFVGSPGASSAIAGVARSQLLLEAAVAVAPAPVIGVNSGSDGTVDLSLNYSDAVNGQTSLLTFTL